MMKQTMRDARLQAQLFRVVDVLPTLQAPAQVVDHVREYLASTSQAPFLLLYFCSKLPFMFLFLCEF
jgi:hypothetical protein